MVLLLLRNNFFAFRGLTSTQCSSDVVFLGEERKFCRTSPSLETFMFLCIYLTPITDCSIGTPSVMKLPLRVKSLCCEEMLADVLGAIRLCPYGVLPVTVVPKLQQVCLILEHQHADEAILSKVDPCLLKALCTVFICTTQMRPLCDAL